VLPLVEYGLRDGRLLGERGAGGWAAPHVINALGNIDAFDRALEVTEQIAAEARRSGAFFGTLFAPASRAWINGRKGDLVACEADMRTSLELLLPDAMALDVATALFFLQDAMVERPSLDDLAAMMEPMEVDPVFATTGAGAMFLEARGRQRLRRGERAAALDDLRACAKICAGLGFAPTYSSWRSTLALALPAEERETARELVDEELALAAATGMARPHGVALRAAGLLEGGDDGIELLRRSVATLEGSEARLELARSLVELGAALRRRHRRSESREHLAAGMELAHRCGATRLVARADEELHATGARPRRPVRSGLDALTPSELRAARLAASGRANVEIAQELFISLKTVETHLGHAYAKLGLSGQGSRAALAGALDSQAGGSPAL
jgi:DNA-binding CsgD family transcriptional regulator